MSNMYKFEIGSIFTTPLGNKIVVIGLEDNERYTISTNNGDTILRGQTEEDIKRLEESID